jgi:hypothetical protein
MAHEEISSSGGRLFVTVGTTNFDALIEAIHSPTVISLLKKEYSVHSITVQLGHGTSPGAALSTGSCDDASYSIAGVQFTAFRLKPSISPYITSANIVISHAGWFLYRKHTMVTRIRHFTESNLQGLGPSWRHCELISRLLWSLTMH